MRSYGIFLKNIPATYFVPKCSSNLFSRGVTWEGRGQEIVSKRAASSKCGICCLLYKHIMLCLGSM